MKRITLLFSIVLILLSLTVFSVAPASAAVRRCDATYEWQTTGGSIGPIRFGEFTAKGECGSTVPNRCRERARSAAKNCMEDHWSKRGLSSPVSRACLSSSNIEDYDLKTVCVKERGAHPRDICFYSIDSRVAAPPLTLASKWDIKAALQAEVCCIYNQGQNKGQNQFSDNKNVHVRLSGRTFSSSGNKSCRSNQVLASDYTIDCTKVRKNICKF
ncbi:MAG: hypothetical protein AAF572_22345 [Cyanobacteria bacterium P01_B01_bin.77]